MTPPQIERAIALVQKLAAWTTCDEDEWEFIDDPYIDNTMADLSMLIRDARRIVLNLNPAE